MFRERNPVCVNHSRALLAGPGPRKTTAKPCTRKSTAKTIQNMFQQDSRILTEMEILFMPSAQFCRTQPSVPRSSRPPALWAIDEQAAVPLSSSLSATHYTAATCCNRRINTPLLTTPCSPSYLLLTMSHKFNDES